MNHATTCATAPRSTVRIDMPSDITMCSGQGCPQRFECFRHRAVPVGFRQDWFEGTPRNPTTGECDAFWSLDRLRPGESEIRARAYALWKRAGRPDGQALQHWQQASDDLEAELQVRLRPADEPDDSLPCLELSSAPK
jgi:Protein of unknown function (DUF2934)